MAYLLRRVQETTALGGLRRDTFAVLSGLHGVSPGGQQGCSQVPCRVAGTPFHRTSRPDCPYLQERWVQLVGWVASGWTAADREPCLGYRRSPSLTFGSSHLLEDLEGKGSDQQLRSPPKNTQGS